ncbi:MFS transporter [Candidatus Njordibacter sp. Uisw_056]|uniref:MFS transporter n=1 Tax=Candidatus Njordibacter sp. Uisw_056 TaxID=3230973 RepID=UPI003D4FBD81
MKALNQLLPLYLSCTLLLMGNGLLFIIIPMSMRLDGQDTDAIGLVMSLYFVGMLLGSLYGRHLISRVGHIRIFAACASVATLCALLHSIWSVPLVWGVLRVLIGFTNATFFMTMETWLNESSTSENRATVFGSYQFVTYFGLALGQLMLNFAEPQDPILYIYVAMLFCLCMIPVLMSRSGGPRINEPESMPLKTLYRTSPLGVVGIMISGICLGAFYNMSSVYGADVGMTKSQIATFMSATMVGGFLLQFPVGKLADIFDRRTVLVMTLLVACLAAMVLPIMAAQGEMIITIACAVILSGALACVYPIALADAFDRLKPSEMVAASGKLILAYATGGAIGPYTSSIVMKQMGADALFGYLIIASLILVAFVMYRMSIRSAVPDALQESFVVQGMTPMATELDPRTEYNSLDETSVAAETVLLLAEENPNDVVEIAVSIALNQPEEAVNIAQVTAYHYPNEAVPLATTLANELPHLKLDIITNVAGSAPQSGAALARYMCGLIKQQKLDPQASFDALSRLTLKLLEEAPQQAAEIAGIVSHEIADDMPELVAKIAVLAAQAAPDQRVEVATAVTQEVPEASVEVATGVAETIAASPDEELHIFLASEEDEDYLGEGTELAIALGQEAPEQAFDIATAVAEVLPEDAAQVAESIAQTDPQHASDLVGSISEVAPEMADDVMYAVASSLPEQAEELLQEVLLEAENNFESTRQPS